MKHTRNKKHLQSIRELPCLIPGCGAAYCEAHHLTITPNNEKGLATKSSDEWAVPLCSKHHRERHNFKGSEIGFFEMYGFDFLSIQKFAQYRWWRSINGA